MFTGSHTHFPEYEEEEFDCDTFKSNFVHLRIQQRNSRKTITTCQGIPPNFDIKNIFKALRKILCANGSITKDPILGDIIQIQGDQRDKIKNFLITEGIVPENHIQVHGF